jgi:hypothetical protein
MSSPTPNQSTRTVETEVVAKVVTPQWIRDILDEIDHVASPTVIKAKAKSVFGDALPKVTASFNFTISALGFAFAVINAIYLSSINERCSGYNSEERNFLYVVSIMVAAFFGVLTISSVYGIGMAFRG